MAKFEDYDSLDGTIYFPKGEQLVNSKNIEGTYLGFTRKTSDTDPYFAHFVPSSDEEDDTEPDETPSLDEDDASSIHNEQEAIDELLGIIVSVVIIGAVAVTAPIIKKWWENTATPFFERKTRAFRRWRAQRKAQKNPDTLVSGAILEQEPLESRSQAATALERYEADMTDAEARQHLIELLIAQHFVEQKTRILANAKIQTNHIPPELSGPIQRLTKKQFRNTLNEILSSQPNFLHDAMNIIQTQHNDGMLQLMREISPHKKSQESLSAHDHKGT